MKPVEVQFDKDAYEEYVELQENVELNKKAKKKYLDYLWLDIGECYILLLEMKPKSSHLF